MLVSVSDVAEAAVLTSSPKMSASVFIGCCPWAECSSCFIRSECDSLLRCL